MRVGGLGASDFAAGLASRRRSVLAVLAASQCTACCCASPCCSSPQAPRRAVVGFCSLHWPAPARRWASARSTPPSRADRWRSLRRSRRSAARCHSSSTSPAVASCAPARWSGRCWRCSPWRSCRVRRRPTRGRRLSPASPSRSARRWRSACSSRFSAVPPVRRRSCGAWRSRAASPQALSFRRSPFGQFGARAGRRARRGESSSRSSWSARWTSARTCSSRGVRAARPGRSSRSSAPPTRSSRCCSPPRCSGNASARPADRSRTGGHGDGPARAVRRRAPPSGAGRCG